MRILNRLKFLLFSAIVITTTTYVLVNVIERTQHHTYAQTTTYFVATTGNDTNPGTFSQPFRTITKGASVLKPGDTLYLRSGTYDEYFVYNKIPGGTSWQNPVTIAGYPGETAIIQPSTGPNVFDVFTFACTTCIYIVLDNLVIDAVNVQNNAIKITYGGAGFSHHIRIQNSEIRNAPHQGVLVTADETNRSDGNEFINLNVHHNGNTWLDHGFYIGSSNNLIERSLIHDNAGYGVQLYNGAVPAITNNNIIRYNKIYDNGWYTHTFPSGTTGNGPGMILGSGSGNLAYNNLLWGNDGGGIQIAYGGSASNKVYNNTIAGNTGNPQSFCIYAQPQTQNDVIQNNICWQNGAGIKNEATGTILSNNLATDPLFVNQTNFDFHLRSGSPAIDAGITLGEVTTDFEGTFRPQGTAPDIGAYEFFTLDSTLPTVSMTAPLEGVTVSGSAVVISASASDNVGVRGVQFTLDGANLGAEDTSAPYSVAWNTTIVNDGPHTLRAVARDTAGNQAISASITVTVNNEISIYYVSTTGDDSNPGTPTQPLRTIQRAADLAQASNTVIVRPGAYRERVTIKNSGTPGNPIIFQGEPGAIIDGGDVFTSWETAPEVGEGVFKKSGLPYNPYSMTWNDKYILRINNTLMADGRGFDLLRMPGLDPRWNGVEAWFGYLNGLTYVRFKNAENPANEAVTFAPYGRGAVTIDGKNFIVIKGFTIKNADNAVLVVNGASDNMIENNLLLGGRNTVSLNVNASRNHVRDNEITLNYIYGDLGHPWRTNATVYNIFDAIKNKGPSNLRGVEVFQAGSDNQIYRNHIFQHFDGVDHYSGGGLVPGVVNGGIDRETHAQFNQRLKIYENTIHNLLGSGTQSIDGGVDIEIHDNLIYEATENMRIKRVTKGPLYIYRNRIYNITQKTAGGTPEGYALYISLYDDPDTPAAVYFYHNSITVEGNSITFAATDPALPPTLGLPNFWFLNNIFSSINLWGAFQPSWTNVLKAHFDYNWAGGYMQPAPWPSAANNVMSPKLRLFQPLDNPDFTLTSYSAALEKGIDLSQPFTVDGVSRGPLPGMTLGYFSGRQPDLGAMQYFPPPFDFSVTNSGPVSVVTGTSVTNTISTAFVSGSSLGVAFSVTGLPQGATASFSPENCTPNCQTTLKILTSVATPVSTYPLTVTVSGGKVSRTTGFDLTVISDTIAPSVSIISPAGGAVVSGIATIAAIASDNVKVSGVKFKVDGSDLGIEDSFAPYAIKWDTIGAANALHTLFAIASDAAGNKSISSPVTVTVNNPVVDKAPPSVSFAEPLDNQIVSGTIMVTALASDTFGVSGVQLKLDDIPLGAEIAAAPYQVSWNTSAVSNGTHQLSAFARDTAGNTTTASIAVTVDNRTPPPTALSVTVTALPASGNAPLHNVTLDAQTTANNVGLISYTFYCDRADTDTSIAQPYAARFNDKTSYAWSAVNVCSYTTPGTYTAKVIVEMGALSAEARTTIAIAQPPTPPPPPPSGGGGGGGGSSPGSIGITPPPPPVVTPLTVTLAPSPQTGTAPMKATLQAKVTGESGATITYTFYCNKSGDDETLTMPADARFEASPTKVLLAPDVCQYTSAGNYTPKVIIETNGVRKSAFATIMVAAPAIPPTPTLILTHNLTAGMQDPDVQKLQRFLKQLGYFPISRKTTSYFNAVTRSAVIKYQKAKGITPANGFVGLETRRLLAGGALPAPPPRILARGMRGPDVLELQKKLQALGFIQKKQPLTPLFGILTEQALKKFQCAKKIACKGKPPATEYGVLGTKTRKALGL